MMITLLEDVAELTHTYGLLTIVRLKTDHLMHIASQHHCLILTDQPQLCLLYHQHQASAGSELHFLCGYLTPAARQLKSVSNG